MRTLTLSLALTIGNAASLLAQQADSLVKEHTPGLVELRINLMFWTLVIFGILYFMLRKWAFPAILSAVEKREKALEDALASAKRDRDEAQKLLDEHRRQIEAARGDAQKLIAEGRAVAEKMRNDLVVAALGTMCQWLGSMRDGRKTVLYVSEGMAGTIPAGISTTAAGATGSPPPGR
jgi:F-type H+-transporting ATPase subunit b